VETGFLIVIWINQTTAIIQKKLSDKIIISVSRTSTTSINLFRCIQPLTKRLMTLITTVKVMMKRR
jgi:hypothetical protein